jgi:hypothetical protein
MILELKVSDCKVLVVGAVRNIETTLHVDVTRFQKVFAGFQEVKFLVIESDSSDKSLEVLEKTSLINPDFKYVSLGDLESKIPNRTERLAYVRNTYLEIIENDQSFEDFEIIAIADFNNLNNKLERGAVEGLFNDNYWSVRTANQSGPYYDIWALRHPIWSPNDCWENLQFLREYKKFPELALYAAVNSRMIKIPKNANPIAVQSAFGGLGVYKRSVIIGKRYKGIDVNSGKMICEHVPFHEAIIQEGHVIEVFPSLINMRKTDHTRRFGLAPSLLRVAKYLPKYLMQSLEEYF